MGIHSNTWTFFDWFGKNSKSNPPTPNIINQLENIAGPVNNLESRKTKRYWKRYINPFYPSIHCHLLLTLHVEDKQVIYSHILYKPRRDPIREGINISISLLTKHPAKSFGSSFMISNYGANNWLEDPVLVGTFAEQIMLYREKNNPQLDSQIKVRSLLPLFDLKEDVFFDSGENNMQKKRLNNKPGLFGKRISLPEPMIFMFYDEENSTFWLNYNFQNKNLEYLQDEDNLSRILGTVF
jgi:hypothetical protein